MDIKCTSKDPFQRDENQLISIAATIRRFACVIGLVGILSAAPAFANDVLLDLSNSHVYSENLVTSAQPTMDQIKELKDAGFEVVINLTPTKEPWFAKEEEKLLEEAGVAYVHVSVSWANPSMDALRQFFSAMKSHSNKKILVHCSHNARASAFVYLYRVALEKAPQQAEYELVEQIWANNPEYPLSKYMIWQDFLTRALPEIQ